MDTTGQLRPVQPPYQHTVPPKQSWSSREFAGVTLFALAGLAVMLIIIGAALSSRYSDGKTAPDDDKAQLGNLQENDELTTPIDKGRALEP